MSKRVIELIRVSTQGQAADDRASIPAQHAINQRTAKTYDLEIVECVKLVNVSGAAVLRTPEMQRLLRMIENPAIHGVVVREFSRVMRPDSFDDYVLLQSFQDTGTVLYLPDGPMDFNSKTGRLLGTIRAAIAGLERSEILERVWAAKEEKRRAGKHPQSYITLPFGIGYDVEKEKFFYKPEAEKVGEAVRLFMAGHASYKDVGHKLGIAPFNLRNILRNPIYTGWRVYTKRRDPSSSAIHTREDGRQGDRPKILRKPDEVIRVKVLDPIISERDFARLQQLLDLKKQNHWRVRPDYERRFLYNGFLRCGQCGNLVYTHGRKGRSWYVCKSRTAEERAKRERQGLEKCGNSYMQRERLETSLNRLISDRLTSRRFLQRVASAYAQRQHGNGAEPEAMHIEGQIEQLAQKKQRVLEAYFENLIDRAERDRRLRALAAEAELYGNLIDRARERIPALTATQLADVFSVFNEWDYLGRADKRSLLRATLPAIHVENYRVVGLSLLPSSGEINPTDKGS